MTTLLDSSLTAASFFLTNGNALISKTMNELNFATFCVEKRFHEKAYFHEFDKMRKESACLVF